MAFCLIAADGLARCDPDDVGSWAPVLRILADPMTSYSGYYGVVRKGLASWRRRLLISADHRLYLVTLACEGGLPLRVLENENARLTRYLRELLLQHETFPSVELSVLAKRHLPELPKTLHNDVVTELASNLIRAVAVIRKEHPRVEDREAALKGPRRAEVPLDLDEQTGRLLLDGLLRSPPPIEAPRTSLPELQVFVDLERNTLRRRPRLPRRLSATALAQGLGCRMEDLRGRMILRLELADGSRHALAAVTPSAQEPSVLMVDPYALRDVTEPGLVRSGAAFVLDDGHRTLGRLAPRGAADLPDELPWSFIAAAGAQEARFVGVGRVRVPDPVLIVSIPNGTSVRSESAVVERIGTIDDRPLFTVSSGDAVWTSDDGVARLCTGQPNDDNDELTLSGHFHELPGVDALFWRGMPTITRADGGAISGLRPQFRQRGVKTPWRSPETSTWGELELRAVLEGATVFGAKVNVLPRSLTLALEGESPVAGRIQLGGCHGVDTIGVTPLQGLSADVTGAGTERVIELAAQGTPPRVVELLLVGREGQRAALEVHFPQRRRGFVSRGRALPDSDEVALADLPYTTAEVLIPGSNSHWELDVSLDGGSRRLASVPPIGDGRARIHLSMVRDDLDLALSTSAELDHRLRLVLSERGEYGGAKLGVRRYETTLIPWGAAQVSIEPQELTRLDHAILSSLRADALPLFDPGQGRTPLQASGPGTWDLPDSSRAVGPWLVLVWQGDYLRCRPLLRTLPGSPPTASDRLSSAMTEGNKTLRREKIANVLRVLAQEPGAKEWALVSSFLGLLPEVPPSALDTLIELVKIPECAAYSALIHGPEAPLRVLTGLERLPLLWEAVPLRAWLAAVRQLERAVDRELRAVVAPWLCQRRPADRPWLSVLHEVLTREVAGLGDPQSPALSLAKTSAGREILLGSAEQLVNDLRVRAEHAWWPTDQAQDLEPLRPMLRQLVPDLAARRSTMPHWIADVVELPWLVALAAVKGDITLDGSDIFAVRRARLFDPTWFDEAYAVALAYLVGWHIDHREGLFRD